MSVEVTTDDAIDDYEAFAARDEYDPVEGLANAVSHAGGVSRTTGEPLYGVGFVALTKNKKASIAVEVFWTPVTGSPAVLAGDESAIISLGKKALRRYQGKK